MTNTTTKGRGLGPAALAVALLIVAVTASMLATQPAQADELVAGDAGLSAQEDELAVQVSSYNPMHRLYNPYSGEHFYTADTNEKNHLVPLGWRYEGTGWYAPLTGSDVYRLYNPFSGDHHYTMSAKERNWLTGLGWRYEGVGWKSGGNVPLYRQYNPNEQVGTHNYTTSKSENDALVRIGWRAEGIAWYGVTPTPAQPSQEQPVQNRTDVPANMRVVGNYFLPLDGDNTTPAQTRNNLTDIARYKILTYTNPAANGRMAKTNTVTWIHENGEPYPRTGQDSTIYKTLDKVYKYYGHVRSPYSYSDKGIVNFWEDASRLLGGTLKGGQTDDPMSVTLAYRGHPYEPDNPECDSHAPYLDKNHAYTVAEVLSLLEVAEDYVDGRYDPSKPLGNINRIWYY